MGNLIQNGRILKILKNHYSPLYVYDGKVIKEKIQSLSHALDGKFDIYYSIKANPNINIF